MPAYPSEGLVLHRFPLSETDRVVTLLSPGYGKFAAVAKGARGPKSRLSGATEPFTRCKMLLATGKTFDIITQCEVVRSYTSIRSNMELLARAAYLCELTDRLLLERQPSPVGFELLCWALDLLDSAPHDPDTVVHAYEMRLLSEVGYQPQLDECVRCRAASDRTTGFSPSLGGAVCDACDWITDTIRTDAQTLCYLRLLLSGEAEELLQLNSSAHARGQVARCMRRHIGYRIDRELKSADFLEMLRSE